MSDRRLTLCGWWLFVTSACFFIAASARAGDTVALIGSLAFMAANISFLIPFYRRSSHEDHDREE
jgi:hypothetical protein